MLTFSGTLHIKKQFLLKLFYMYISTIFSLNTVLQYCRSRQEGSDRVGRWEDEAGRGDNSPGVRTRVCVHVYVLRT